MAAAVAPLDLRAAAASPWLAPLGAALALIDAADVNASHARLSAQARVCGLVTGQGAPLQFVAADAAGREPYERFIARTGAVPTRANTHDLFNAAVWLTWPRVKAALNARQAAELAAGGHRPTAARGPQRDAATLLDESGMLIAVSDDAAARELRDLLRRHDWHRVFVAHRDRWHRHWVPYLIGHAVMEKLMRPFPAITVRVTAVLAPGDALHVVDTVDRCAAQALTADRAWHAAAMPPLPVLGVPGWWRANAEASFYDNPRVFRPARGDAPALRAD